VKQLGALHILVNNAGVTEDGLLARMSLEAWKKVLDTNLTGAFLLTKAAARPMMKQREGRIVNVSSVVGIRGNAGQANYAASKAGLIGFTKSVARELAPRNVTANVVAPGFIATDMTAKLTEDQKAGALGQVPLGAMGTSRDVADAVLFLASPLAAYITGAVLTVDGGMAM
jgi:3-oxoacyl-[acyl-carrier protein] reductase